jgi:hypothetical protein
MGTQRLALKLTNLLLDGNPRYHLNGVTDDYSLKNNSVNTCNTAISQKRFIQYYL